MISIDSVVNSSNLFGFNSLWDLGSTTSFFFTKVLFIKSLFKLFNLTDFDTYDIILFNISIAIEAKFLLVNVKLSIFEYNTIELFIL